MRARDGVSQSARFLLADVMDIRHIGYLAYKIEHFGLVVFGKLVFELDGPVKMVLNGFLGTAGDDDNILDAGLDGFLDDKLNRRLVHDRKHLLGLRLCGRQKAGAKSRRGYYGFFNAHSFPRYISFLNIYYITAARISYR
ncbi:hypothetical protein SDC9_164980 [bioreactor metagenome]|uniref:Uncharacterized protein n=1 Tax=bioreactor metagenome TaxID=1076179 RepID=A0A645FT35_9ZZZZ